MSADSVEATLEDIVREALLAVLADSESSAAAKASAGRTLMQFCNNNSRLEKKRGAEMSRAELDQAIAEYSIPVGSQRRNAAGKQ